MVLQSVCDMIMWWYILLAETQLPTNYFWFAYVAVKENKTYVIIGATPYEKVPSDFVDSEGTYQDAEWMN